MNAADTIQFCRYAELLSDNRTFTTEEEDQFDKRAWFAYESFRDRAAAVSAFTKGLAMSLL